MNSQQVKNFLIDTLQKASLAITYDLEAIDTKQQSSSSSSSTINNNNNNANNNNPTTTAFSLSDNNNSNNANTNNSTNNAKKINSQKILEAKKLYIEVSNNLNQILNFIPNEYSKLLTKYSKLYLERANQLNNLNNINKLNKKIKYSILEINNNLGIYLYGNNYNQHSLQQFTPNTQQNTQQNSLQKNTQQKENLKIINNPYLINNFFKIEESLPNIVPIIPPSIYRLRPYWLMNQLQNTMLNGGYLMNGLFISKNVWFQKGAKLYQQSLKIEFCQNLSNFLLQLKENIYLNENLIIHYLNLFLEQLNSLNIYNSENNKKSLQNEIPQMDNSISNKMFIFGKSMFKTISNTIKGNIKEDINEQPYIPWLIQVFTNISFLEELNNKYCNSQHASNLVYLEIFEKISNFFYSTICHFVLQDLQVLLERYIRKCKESTNKLFETKNIPYV
ncbi:hypothetical protein ABK040_001970 [Willaertia magna]